MRPLHFITFIYLQHRSLFALRREYLVDLMVATEFNMFKVVPLLSQKYKDFKKNKMKFHKSIRKSNQSTHRLLTAWYSQP